MLSAILVCLIAAACGGGGGGNGTTPPGPPTPPGDPAPPAYTIGGTVSGLAGTMVLQNNLGDDLTVSMNGAFQFSIPIAGGASYSVSVKTQPANQVCQVVGGSGTTAASNITSIVLTCSTNAANTFSVSGQVSGLTGSGLLLQNNAGDDLSVPANGPFTFPTTIAAGGSYAVTVKTQPVGQTCVVNTGTGSITTVNITNVAIACAANPPGTHSIGGSVIGLVGSGLVLQNNAGDDLTVNGPAATFAFQTRVVSGNSYAVTVLKQPTNPVQSCTVANGSGMVSDADVTAPTINCVTQFARFGYVANSASVSMFTIDSGTGQWRNRGYVQTVGNLGSLSLDPSGRFAYVETRTTGTISAYSIDPVTGALTEVTGSQLAIGSTAHSVIVDPTGKFMYAAAKGLWAHHDKLDANVV